MNISKYNSLAMRLASLLSLSFMLVLALQLSSSTLSAASEFVKYDPSEKWFSKRLYPYYRDLDEFKEIIVNCRKCPLKVQNCNELMLSTQTLCTACREHMKH